MSTATRRFKTGLLVMTRGAADLARRLQEQSADGSGVAPYYRRYLAGDWGDIDREDQASNEEALRIGERLLGAYKTPAGDLWIITERDRSVTTMLLPEEY